MSASPPRRPKPAVMHKLKSSNLAAVGYDADTKEVHVDFQSGGSWVYGDCSPELFEKLRQHESPGSFFHRNIKQVLPGRKAGS